MMRVVQGLDEHKFGSKGPFIHDPQVMAYMMNPQFYAPAQTLRIRVEHEHDKAAAMIKETDFSIMEQWRRGSLHEDPNGYPAQFVTELRDVEGAQRWMYENIARTGETQKP